MEIKEAALSGPVAEELIALSADWEAEGSSYGYRKNGLEDLEGNRIFAAIEGGQIIGYLFGSLEQTKEATSVIPEDAMCFEVKELYVKPAYRSRGIGSALFRYAESSLAPEAEYFLLGTATKNFRSILHFYIDELGMAFWSARLFKPLQKKPEMEETV